MTSVLAGLMMASAPVYAQTVDQIPDEAVEEFEDEDQVVVTGSRIRRPDVESVFPTTVVDAVELQDRAFTNIADALGEIPAFGGGVDPLGNQGANIGANFVDFLDLGVQRTLTLVNGRRFVPGDVSGNGLSVDFNVIPLALVERIETIGVGGAPVYGADAIAGTINVILRDDYEGFQATALFGETQAGDSERTQFQIVTGANTADGRGNVTFAAEYFNQEGLSLLDRPDFFTDEQFLSEVPCGTAGFTDLDGNGDGIVCPADDPAGLAADSVFRAFNIGGGNGQNVQLFTNGGTIGTVFGGAPLNDGVPGTPRLFLPAQGLGGLQFLSNGDLVPFEAGVPIPGQSAFFAQGGTTFDFFDEVGQIQSPLERINFSSTFRYDITDNIRFKGDAQIANTKSDELANQGGFQTFAFDGITNNDLGGALQLPVSNPFLSQQNRDVLAANGFGGDDVFFFSRFNNDLLNAGERGSETFVWRFTGGLEGDFEFAGREFFWDAYGAAGQTTNETDAQPILNDTRFLNAIDAVQLSQADVDAISAAGNNPIGQAGDIVCQVTLDLAGIPVGQRTLSNDAFTSIRGIVSGSGVANLTAEDVTACQPLNLFGDGVASAEALDYVTQRGVSSNDLDQRIWSANFGGQLIELPAGWAQFNVGYEARSEAASFLTSGAIEVGLGRGAATPSSGGRISSDEFYGELLVPIVSPDLNIPFVDTLEAEGAIREIKSSLDGGDATTWTVAGTYKPVPDLTFKGNITRSVRSPSVTELFLPTVTSFQFGADPCDTRNIADDVEGQTGVRAANCAAVGITQPFTSDAVNATVQGTTGGNPNLTVETADAFTIGTVIQPRWVPGLTFQADYINIEVESLIAARTLGQNLASCFDQVNFDPNSAACTSFQRDPNNQIVNFQAGQLNADVGEFEFLNFRADYNFDVSDAFGLFGQNIGSDLGTIGLDANAFHQIERAIIVDGATPDNVIGGFANPRWRGTVDLTYNYDGLRFFWRTLWQDRNLFSPSGNNNFADENDNIIRSVGGRFMHNASISYDLSNLTDSYDKPIIVQLNVDNVFNRRPGRAGFRRAFGNFNTAETFGRRFTFRVSANF